ncbi:MAG: CBS domain-containing protein [bacterium]|nr:CBS domain-containing protein [bacterium]
MKLETQRARDLMTRKIVRGDPEETLREAALRMDEHGIHGLLIDPPVRGRGYCILTIKDCIEVICEAGEEALDSLCVEDAMTRPALTIPADLLASDCIRLMRHAGVRMAPVVEGVEAIGILTFTDVLRACARPEPGS